MRGEVVWDETADVVVVGLGAAGAVAAIEAHDAKAKVLVLEKMSFPGGLSVVSAGGIRVSDDPDAAFAYLKATCGGRTPDDVLRALADGMVEVPDYMRRLAEVSGARISVTAALGNYPLPGHESLAYCQVAHVPGLEEAGSYHAVNGLKEGCKLFKILEDNLLARDIPIRYGTPARRLIRNEAGEIAGVLAECNGAERRIRARHGVILTCGGFENNAEMKRQYFQADPVLAGSFLGNTGDGIAMAQEVGAALWHMWHYHGPYGMRHPDPEFQLSFYMKAVPMWTPGRPDKISDLGVTDAFGRPASQKNIARMAWILVDQDGRRFMDEYPPYPGDTGVRPFDVYDFKAQRFPRLPAFALFDEDGRRMYPIGRAIANDPVHRYQWSPDNLREIEMGILRRGETLADLAEAMGVPGPALEETVARWNRCCDEGRDPDFGRRGDTMVPIRTPPFYFAEIWPVVINTQGGPVHNASQQVLNPFGEPIPRLYAAGELGSVFGHVYVGGGNLAECVVGGWTAGRAAAALPPQPD